MNLCMWLYIWSTDLAFHIINLYNGLVHYVDEEGFSPLDTLATKPSCFKSGSNLRGWDKIIYKCKYIINLKHYMHVLQMC